MTKLTCCLLCCVWFANLVMETSTYDANQIDLTRYLQPDETTLRQFRSGKYCARECRKDEPPRICYYIFKTEDYHTVGDACGDCPNNMTHCYASQCVPADGFEKAVRTVNRHIPGPSIEVCLRDRVIIDVINTLVAKSITIHWHGVFQKGTPYMDGVPGLTQCAILEGNTFRYDFWANNEGTHFWHSHDGLQKLDGIQGHFIVRIPKEEEPNGKLYDEDTPMGKMMFLDWIHTLADERFPGHRFQEVGQDAENFLLNGYGRTELPESQGNRSNNYPLGEIKVQQNKRYRLRMVGGLCTVCGVQVSIERHNMTVIATDGNPVKPVTVNSINLFSGERYDVVLKANQPPGNYWIHIKGISCGGNEVYGLGILKYANAPSEEFNSEAPGYDGFIANGGKVLNPQNATCGGESNNVCVTQLQNALPSETGSNVCDYIIPLEFGFHVFETEELFRPNNYERFYVAPTRALLASWVNNISFAAPSSPLLSQYRESMKDRCPLGRNNLPICPDRQSYCECTQVIKVPLRRNICIITLDISPAADLQHPFHLHGFAFNVIALDQFKDGQTTWDIIDAIKSGNLAMPRNPAFKDAVAVPSNGYAVIKFYTDNPGIWFYHCHFMYHLASGMAVAIQVGDPRDWPRVPPGFPQCGNYEPPAYYQDNRNGVNYPDYY